MTTEALHHALKGLVAGDAQQIRVTSLVVEQERRWIQIELVGPRHYSMLVSADLRRDPGMIRSALESWMTGEWTAETAATSGVMIHNATIRLGDRRSARRRPRRGAHKVRRQGHRSARQPPDPPRLTHTATSQNPRQANAETAKIAGNNPRTRHSLRALR